MAEELSAGAQRVLACAYQWALGQQRTSVEPLDMLAGLLAEPESEAVALLKEHGGNVTTMIAVFPATTGETLDGNEQLLHPDSHRVVTQARELALYAANYQEVGTVELLVALVEHWESAALWLGEHGVDTLALAENYHRARVLEPLLVDSAEVDWQAGQQADFVESHQWARIMDANINRAREALRVLEDHARFAMGDPHLSGRYKHCRHQLRGAVDFLPGEWLLAARDSIHDVGTGIKAADEYHRAGFAGIVAANAKRAQEAVRALEEYAKWRAPRAATLLEQLRYDLYALERSHQITHQARGRLARVVLCWLVDPETCAASLDWMVEQAIAGGVQMIQLRDKRATDRELFQIARDLRRWTKEKEVLLIVNDRPDLARLVDADGVHVGQDDVPVQAARQIVGPDALVGVSTHNIEQAAMAQSDGADYLGIGPVFPSGTKVFSAFPGLDYVRAVAARISLPAFCIGGIDTNNLPEVVAAGGRRVAVGQVINAQSEPAPVARTLRNLLEDANPHLFATKD